ncbi:MAG: CBS and ACT domain-containing protein [Methylocystaceae bacterium]
MKVKDRMSANPFTVNPDTNVAEAFKMMKDKNIRRLPVVEKNKLISIVTLSDLNQAAPSSATTLSIYELNYLLAKTKIKDILGKTQLIAVNQNAYIEVAAKMLRENKIGGMPVVDDDGKLVGIITETDIFDSFLEILGVNRQGTRINLLMKDRPGILKMVAEVVYNHGVNIENIVSLGRDEDGRVELVLRFNSVDYQPIVEDLKKAGFEIEGVVVKQ